MNQNPACPLRYSYENVQSLSHKQKRRGIRFLLKFLLFFLTNVTSRVGHLRYAGHVLGACQYLIEIAGVKILYTGDYSREEDRILPIAEVPSSKPDIMITGEHLTIWLSERAHRSLAKASTTTHLNLTLRPQFCYHSFMF